MPSPHATRHAVEILAEDHRWIRRMTTCLERIAVDAVETGRVDAESCPMLLALFEHFADGLHQQKEERSLCARLLSRAGLSDKAVIAKLIGEHEAERQQMRKLHQHLFGGVMGVPRPVLEFARQAEAYVHLHRTHMAHEEAQLLPMANRLLDEASDRAVCLSFTELDTGFSLDRRAVFEHVAAICERLGV